MIIEPVLQPENADWPHKPNGDEWWQESVVLGWTDTKNEIGGFIRLSHQPNRQFEKLCFGVVSRNGPGYTRNAQDLPFKWSDRWENGFIVDGFCSVTFDGQTSRWIAKDEHVELEIDVRDAHPAYDFMCLIEASEVSKNMFSNHIQGGGSFSGRIKIGGVEREISGETYRDHSWGTRLLHNPKADFYSAWWLGGSFGPDFAYGFGDGKSQSGHSMPYGYIVKDGKTYLVAVKDASIAVSFADAMSNRSAKVTVYCEELGNLTFEATGFGNVVLEMEKKHFELSMPCAVTCNGRTGGGSIETIFNPRNGGDRPFWLEGAALKNGPNEWRDAKLVQPPFSRN